MSWWVTNREVDRMRAAAERGLTVAQASRLIGRPGPTVQAHARRGGFCFVDGHARVPPHPAPDILAVARLMRTMDRLRTYGAP